MCNAWNHRPGCSCGWGGGNYTSDKTLISKQIFFNIRKIIPTYNSFVNPNASCPVCGESVFFYQSPFGGRVFFDELGPPWPKHGCTNSQSTPNKPAPTINNKTRKYSWIKNGWNPFIISNRYNHDKNSLRIEGEYKQKKITIYLNKKHIKERDEFLISPNTIAHIKKVTDDEYRISFIFGVDKNKCITAYRYPSMITNQKNHP